MTDETTVQGDRSVAVGRDVSGSTIITGPIHIHWTATTAPTQREFIRYLRMLAVVAAPVTGFTVSDRPPAPLDLWAEWRRLEEAIHTAWDVMKGQGSPWAVVRLNPPTRDSLADALAAGDSESAYQLVHFSGHGTPHGLTLEDALGRTDFVAADELVDLFRNRAVRLVVLNACQTERIACRLQEDAGVAAVIATTDALRDDEASLFTSRLYAWLARGQSVAKAFVEARSALRHAYERGQLSIPPDELAGVETYVARRLAVPVLFGDSCLSLPSPQERAAKPFLTLAEPPSRGLELRLIEGFVGRGPALVQVARWLRDRPSPVIALSGLGGIGKSALAAMAVLRGSWRFEAVAALSAREAPHLKPDALVRPLDAVLGKKGEVASAPTEAERLARAIAALNETPTLLVLDNLEDLTETASRAWADFLGRLDPRRGSLAILTLRPAVKHPLTDLAGPAHLRLERLSEQDAMRLLAEHVTIRNLWDKVPSVHRLALAQRTRLEILARRAYLTWLPLGRLAALAELAQRAGCHPLALRLALGDLGYPHVDWSKAMNNVSDLRGRDWEAQAEAMVGRMVADLAQTDPRAMNLLRSLLVFRSGASYEAFRAVCMPDADEEVFDEHLRAALDASLLEYDWRASKYDLHPLTRSFLTKQEIKGTELVLCKYRYMEYFRKWMEDHSEEYDLLERELPDLTNAFGLICQNLDESGLIFNLWDNWFFILKGYWREYDQWTVLALEAVERLGDEEAKAKMLVDWGCLKTEQYKLTEARQTLVEGRAILEKLGAKGDPKRLCIAILFQGYVAYREREFQLSTQYAEEARRIAQEENYRGPFASATNLLAQIASKEGDRNRARKRFAEAEETLRNINNERRLAAHLLSKGISEIRWGSLGEAKTCLREALQIARKLRLAHIVASCKLRLAQIAGAENDRSTALLLVRDALSTFERLGNDRDAKEAEALLMDLESPR